MFPKEDVTDSAMQTASAVNPFSVVCKTRKECGKTKRSTESQVELVAGGGVGYQKEKLPISLFVASCSWIFYALIKANESLALPFAFPHSRFAGDFSLCMHIKWDFRRFSFADAASRCKLFTLSAKTLPVLMCLTVRGRQRVHKHCWLMRSTRGIPRMHKKKSRRGLVGGYIGIYL